jgi:hypothetical protein
MKMARIPVTRYLAPLRYSHIRIAVLPYCYGCRIQDARCRIGRVRILATWYPGPGTWHPCPIPTFQILTKRYHDVKGRSDE